MSRMTAPVGEVTTPTILRQERRLALARGVEQPLLGEFPAPRLEERHQRADPGELERFDHDLVGRLAGEGGQSPGRDDFEPLLGLEPHALERGAPNDGVEPRVGVLQAKIGVARRLAAAVAGNLAPDAHIAEPVFDGALERVREFADGDFGRIGGARRPRLPSPHYARSGLLKPHGGEDGAEPLASGVETT